MTKARLWTLARIGLSAAVLFVVLRMVNPADVVALVQQADLTWLLFAVLLRVFVVGSRIVRIGIGLTHWCPPPWRGLFRIGLMAALMNQALPARGGDLVAIGLLKRDLDVPLGASASAFLTTNLVTGVVTALFYAGVLAVGASHWEALLAGGELNSLSYATLGLLVAVGVVVVVIRRFARATPTGNVATSLRDLAEDARTGMTPDWRLAANTVLGAFQLVVSIGSIAALLPALGIDIRLPLAAVVLYLVLTNVVATALPEALGASSATSGLVVLTSLGATQEQAVAFAGLAWVVRVLPLVVLGAGPLIGHAVSNAPTRR